MLLVPALVAALEAGSHEQLARIADPSQPGHALQAAQDALELHRDIVVSGAEPHAFESTGDVARFALDLEATGTAVNGSGLRQPLPRRWVLEATVVGGAWKLRRAQTAEARLAASLARADQAAITAAVAADPALDMPRFRQDLANVGADEYAGGKAAVEWALASARAAGDARGECTALRMQSYVALWGDPADPAAAATLAREALVVATRAGVTQCRAEALFSLGLAQWMGHDPDIGVLSMLAAADLVDELEDPRLAHRALYMAGFVEIERNRIREALMLGERLRAQLARYPWLHGDKDLAERSGALQEKLGNVRIALEAYERAARVARLLGYHEYERLTIEAARLHSKLGDDAAVRQVLDGLGGERATARLVEARAALLFRGLVREGRLDAAAELLEAAIASARGGDDRWLVGTLLAARSEIELRRGNLDEALELALAACAHAEGARGSALRHRAHAEPGWAARTALGNALRAAGRSVEAEAAYGIAILHVERLRREQAADPLAATGLLMDRLAPYRAQLDLFVEQGRAWEALGIAESMRARGLRDALESRDIDVSAVLSAEERQRAKELEERLVQLNRAILEGAGAATSGRRLAERDEARLALQTFRSELRAAHPELRREAAAPLAGATADLQRLIPPGGAAVELVLAEESTIAFVLRGPGEGARALQVHRLPVGALQLTPLVEQLAGRLANRDLAVAAAARQLYDLLVAPLEAELRGVRTLAVVPDGVLWRVPFRVLADGSGRVLAERVALFRAPSLQALTETPAPARPPGQRRLLALANPSVSGATSDRVRASARDVPLGALPEAEDEVHAVAGLYGSARSEVHVGAAARERIVKDRAPSFDVLHLATHGLLDDGAPLFSSLVLASAPGDGEDGLLEMHELAALRLAGALVILSACDTGGGRVQAGEGLVGMSWALLAAGASGAIVADWQADSAATEILMVDLHRRLMRGDAPAEALRGAQAALRRNPRYSHPYYWAPFSAVGRGW